MKKGFYRFLISTIVTTLVFPLNIFAACSLLNSVDQPAVRTHDALGLLLYSSDAACPQTVFSLRQLLKNSGLTLQTTLVANQGFHNPTQGSFSLFEVAVGSLKTSDSHLMINPGDFFFGHFTTISPEGYLIADQNPEKNALMIEAFAWDSHKEMFNFYELRGNGTTGQWFYRGDSADIFADNELLHRQPDPQHPQFGTRLRCSGCHGGGGPIMKELHIPHNDWWEPKRKLNFGGLQPDVTLLDILETLVSADQLAQNVVLGMKKLNNRTSIHQKNTLLSLQEQLRPLFCPVELNLMSDIYPNEEKQAEISVPAEFFIDSRLLNSKEKQTLKIFRADYTTALTALGSYFPETDLNDADHAWLTPVKAKSDILAVDHWIKQGLIDKKFMLDVLDVDKTNPVFSSARCKLLRFLPNVATANWRERFIKNLSESQDWAAKKLLKNLNSPQQNSEFYMQKAKKFLQKCQLNMRNQKNVLLMYRLLAQRRAEISVSEISANPRGQILEPGFRVIFPENEMHSLPGALKLTLACDVVEQ